MKKRIVALALACACVASAAALDEGAPAVSHRLTRGQTLAAVARLYGIPLASLQAANPGLDPYRLEVGSTLNVPAPTAGWPHEEVQDGEDAAAFAARLGMNVELLKLLNPSVDLAELTTGQTLQIVRSQAAPAAAPGVSTAAPAAPGAASAATSPPAAAENGEWELVTLPDGRRGWAPRSALLVPSTLPLAPQQLVDLAGKFVGAPYRWGGQSPNGVDCSGFVQEVFRLAGHALPRLADEQFTKTAPIDAPQLGDLVFFSTYLPGPSHVGISLGGQEFLHASSSRGVIRASLDEPYFKTRYLGARRLPAWNGSPAARVEP
jgi:cell wall-associated NlpC family hydrolase